MARPPLAVAHPLRGLVVLVAVCLTGTVGLAVSASAAGDGAQVFHGTRCGDAGFGTTFCDEGTSVFLMKEAASGNISITDESHIASTVTTADGCVFTTVNTFHAHTLVKAGVFQDDHALGLGTVTFNAGCGLPPFTCTFTEHFHFANGVFQYERFTNDCTPL